MAPFDSILDNIAQVITLDTTEQQYFCSLLTARRFKKKEFVLHAGDTCKQQTFVVRGCLKIFYTDAAGVEHTVKFAPENWWAFDLQSFTQQQPAFYSIQAIEDTETYQIAKDHHDTLYDRVPKFEKFSRVMFQNAYILLQHRMTQNLAVDAEEKYQHFSIKYPGLEQRIAQKEIAAYLGITPEFLSMLRRKRKEQAIS